VGRKRVVHGAANAQAGTVANVGINHRGGEIPVPEEFLDGSNIITIL
jgi:hypothetical protein